MQNGHSSGLALRLGVFRLAHSLLSNPSLARSVALARLLRCIGSSGPSAGTYTFNAGALSCELCPTLARCDSGVLALRPGVWVSGDPGDPAAFSLHDCLLEGACVPNMTSKYSPIRLCIEISPQC